MDKNEMIIDWVATGLGWLGTMLVGQDNTRLWKSLGWLCWLIATSIWVYVGFVMGVTGLMVANLGYLVFESAGLVKSLRIKS